LGDGSDGGIVRMKCDDLEPVKEACVWAPASCIVRP
jgi:hypothetical protein